MFMALMMRAALTIFAIIVQLLGLMEPDIVTWHIVVSFHAMMTSSRANETTV